MNTQIDEYIYKPDYTVGEVQRLITFSVNDVLNSKHEFIDYDESDGMDVYDFYTNIEKHQLESDTEIATSSVNDDGHSQINSVLFEASGHFGFMTVAECHAFIAAIIHYAYDLGAKSVAEVTIYE